MQQSLNQIFYPVNKFDTTNVDNLKKYMLTEDFLKNALNVSSTGLKSCIREHMAIPENDAPVHPFSGIDIKKINNVDIDNEISYNKNPSEKENNLYCNDNNIYYLKSPNSLFWSTFIGNYGINEYEMVRNKTTREMEENHKIVDYFKTTENKMKLKNTNIKITNAVLQELIADIMTNSANIVQKSLVYSVYYNKPIYVIKPQNKTYLKYIPKIVEVDENIGASDIYEPIIIHYSPTKKSYGVNTSLSNVNQIIDDLNNNYVCLESHDKPLKGLSYYKVCDLDEIAQKLNIDKHVKKTKGELYQCIYDYISW